MSLLDKIEINADDINDEVVGEGSKIFDVDQVLYVCVHMWLVERNKIVSDLDRARMLVEEEIREEEEKAAQQKEVCTLYIYVYIYIERERD